MWKTLFEKLSKLWVMLLFSATTLAVAVVALSYLSNFFQESNVISASGQQNLFFRVFYVENEVFSANPIPHYLSFLMLYTDYIEIGSSFAANFSEEANINLTYSSEKRLVIRYGGAPQGQIIFEETFPLAQGGKAMTASYIYLAAGSGNGGVYTICPRDYIGLYMNFIEDYSRRLGSAFAQRIRNFSAELVISFTHTIIVPEFGLNEVLAQSMSLPLSADVFTIETTGVPSFGWERDLAARDAQQLSLPIAIMFVALFASSVFGLLHFAKKLASDENRRRHEIDAILKKYSNDIVIYDRPVNLARYELMKVDEFVDLMKLAITLGKNIMCYTDEDHAEFVVIADGVASLYVIDYGDGGL